MVLRHSLWIMSVATTASKRDDHEELSEEAQAAAPFVRTLGNVAPSSLHKYIAAADILVQPGRDDEFNRFRFPSNLPMCLASGRPVILPDANIGKLMCDGANCLLLRSGDTDELVALLERLIEKPVMTAQISAAGRKCAQENFNWQECGICASSAVRTQAC
jgi:glycosyltransferase involved in cell wall biosynthesis